MTEAMTFPKTLDEFLEQYKIVDTEQVYTNGSELVPIFRIKQWEDAHKPRNDKKFIEIVVNYPAICPYPEYWGDPYFSIRYEENGKIHEGFCTYKPEVLSEYIREHFMVALEEPEIVRCKDCIYGDWVGPGLVYCNKAFIAGSYCDEDFFCRFGERKEKTDDKT